MGSAGRDDSSQKLIEPHLVNIGNRLLRRPSSTDKLLILLEKAESLLAKVWQQPPMSTSRALLPTMKALITDELLHNHDVDVQVAVASCFNELTRITAPQFTYDDDTLREIFRLFMVALKHLSCESGRNYYRALQIVETMAEVRSSLMLLDVDKDGLVVEMFQLFLDNMRSNHPSDVFKHMETSMTLVIEESDEISFELLMPLLASVKMTNKDTSPVSWELGKKVFENCATKLECYLREALKAMDLKFDDYAEIVASICRGTSTEKNMVLKEVTPTAGDGASQLDGLSKAVHENCDPRNDDGNETNLDHEKSLETLKGCHHIVQSGADRGALRKRGARKLNSVVRPDEGYEHTRKAGARNSREVSPDGYNNEKEAKRGQSKKKQSMANQHNNLEFSSTLKRKIVKLKERGYDALKKTGKRCVAGSSNIRVDKEEGIPGDTSKERKHQLLPEKPYERQKMEESPMSKPAKPKFQRKENEKKSRRFRGEDLVNRRIQVWWPMDEMYYAGTVKAFNPETKRHKILYDDNEIEILNLRKETWKLFGDKYPRHKQEAGWASPPNPKEPIKTKGKNSKRKADMSKKQDAASSSKRSKCENRSIRENSSPCSGRGVDGSNDEPIETNVVGKDDGENHVDKEELETHP